jgi:peptidase M28-like protein
MVLVRRSLSGAAIVALLAVESGNTARVPPAADQAIAAIASSELRADVEVLASDAMGGRAVGLPGNQQAAEYIAAALQRAGVRPASDSYLQPVDLYQPSLGARARLTAGEPGKTPLIDLGAGPQFYPLPQSAPGAVSGRLIFAGHGISAPKARHDDYASLDARGAIVLVLDDAPEALRQRPGLADAERIALATTERKILDARVHGASALIIVRQAVGDARMIWPDTSSSANASYQLYSRVHANPLAVAVMSEQAALPLRAALDRNGELTATLDPGMALRRLTAFNVIATVDPAPGSPDETVVLGAHFDHEGTDDSGRVFNGADDNASGTAAVLAIARALARAAAAGQRPHRRIVLALWNAEEEGSLGAESYLDTAGPARIVANINLDMIGRGEEVPDPRDARYRGFRKTTAAENANVVHMLGYSYSPDLAELADRANERTKLKIKQEYDRDAQGLIQRSDNWPFLRRSIPAVYFTTGLHPDYHTVDDDVERLDFAKLERIAELAGRLAWLAAENAAPRFRSR